MEEAISDPWTMFTYGSSCLEGSGDRLILTNPEGVEFTYALRFEFNTSNNEAEYEALLVGLRISEQIGVKNQEAKVDSRLEANQINGSYVAKEQSMIQYLEKAKALISEFKKFSIEQVPRSENKKADALSKIASTNGTLPAEARKILLADDAQGRRESTIIKCDDCKSTACAQNPQAEANTQTSPWPFYNEEFDISAPFQKLKGRVNSLSLLFDYCSMDRSKTSCNDNRKPSQKFVWDNFVCKFGLLGEIVSDNGKQFRDNPFKDWCEKLNIKQRFASVKHPQTNGQMEKAHRTTIKINNGNTSFSLTYGTEAVIPVEIGMPSLRCAKIDQAVNDEALLLNLDVLEEEREKAAIQEARSKVKMERYYNAKVSSTIFRRGDFVYRNNEASHAMERRKLGPQVERT
ncbi:reverse transcriptase domain-containing protein [Tanacetum coccineum]